MKSKLCYRGKKIRSRSISERSGSEGPAHDPYAWEEVRVEQNGKRYVLRTGSLGYMRLSVDGRKVAEEYEGGGERLWKRFERLTGVTQRALEKALDRQRARAYLYEDYDNIVGYL